MNIKTLKYKVGYCLNKYEEARNSDIKLANAVIYEFYNSKVTDINGELWIKLNNIYDVPKFSDIERVRRKFNEKLMYLPTNKEIAIQRKIGEQEWKKAMGYDW